MSRKFSCGDMCKISTDLIIMSCVLSHLYKNWIFSSWTPCEIGPRTIARPPAWAPAILSCTRPGLAGYHDDVIKWKHFPRYWPFVRGIHRSPVNSPHKGQWRGALMFTLICARINGWVNNCKAGDLRRKRAYYDVIVMIPWTPLSCGLAGCWRINFILHNNGCKNSIRISKQYPFSRKISIWA